MVYTFTALSREYAALWRDMRVSDAKRAAFNAVARRLYASRERFAAVTAATGVPMCVIAVIHERESGGNFGRYLGNGQRLDRVTTIVPKGRGPFPSWEAGAIDALKLEGAHKVTRWTIERALFVLEPYNGYGYRNKGLRSPYLWAGTNLQERGKYVRDGVFDPSVMDPQLGCAGLLAALWTLDPTWRLPMDGEPPVVVVPPFPPIPRPRPPVPKPPLTPAQQGGLAGIIAAIIGGFVFLRDQIAAILKGAFTMTDFPWFLVIIGVAIAAYFFIPGVRNMVNGWFGKKPKPPAPPPANQREDDGE